MKNHRGTLLILVGCLGTVGFGCRKKLSDPPVHESAASSAAIPEVMTAGKPGLSDQQIAAKVYAEHKFPSGFFTESLDRAFVNYLWRVNPGVMNPDEQFATDDPTIALQCAEQRMLQIGNTSKRDNPLPSLTVLPVNDKYFEFTYPINGHPDARLRVHKKSYFDGLQYDRKADSGHNNLSDIGTINIRPITTPIVVELFDRIWFYRNYNHGGQVVLYRKARKLTSDEIKYSVTYTDTVFGDYGTTDEITVRTSEFIVNVESGETLIKHSKIKEITGRSNPNPNMPGFPR